MIDATPQDLTPVDATPGVVALERVQALELAMRELPDQLDIEALTSHHFADRAYMRVLALPAGAMLVGKQHRTQNFFLLVQGSMAIVTPGQEPVVIHAPYLNVVQAGDKRAGVAITDCVCMNFHPNPDNERDLAVLEDRYIIPAALNGPEREKLT